MNKNKKTKLLVQVKKKQNKILGCRVHIKWDGEQTRMRETQNIQINK